MTERRLVAILVADVVGYSKLVGADEGGTLARLQVLRREVVYPAVANHAARGGQSNARLLIEGLRKAGLPE